VTDQPGRGHGHGGASSEGEIGFDQAVGIALARAGLTAADVDFVSQERDEEHGRMVYEIEFVHGATEYSFEIDAATGAIVEEDHDIENFEVHGD
jgi:uncharacterized membrane protein YkoI